MTSGNHADQGAVMSKLFATLRHEFITVLPPTLFFLAAFNVISLTNALLLKQHGIDIWSFAAACVGALLVGKVVLVADKLRFVNRFPNKPLIYNTLWKTAIYVAAVFVVRYAEHLAPFILDYGSVAAAHEHLLNEVSWPRFWAIQIWLFVLFFVYSAFRELVREIGRGAVLKLFFGRPTPSEVSS